MAKAGAVPMGIAGIYDKVVCASTREQVLVANEELKKASLNLITHENLDNLLLRIRFNPSADAMLNELLASGAAPSV